jgi:hypothetical protein
LALTFGGSGSLSGTLSGAQRGPRFAGLDLGQGF